MKKIQPPAPRPCGSCPYRVDVPSGVWDESEYEKLPEYDEPTWAQPTGVFMCHQQDGRMCGGWAATHDLNDSMALRLATLSGFVSPEDVDAILDYVSPVEVFRSGSEAALHGLQDIEAPSAKAVALIRRIERKLK